MECPQGHGPLRQIIKDPVTREVTLKCPVCGHRAVVPESETACG